MPETTWPQVAPGSQFVKIDGTFLIVTVPGSTTFIPFMPDFSGYSHTEVALVYLAACIEGREYDAMCRAEHTNKWTEYCDVLFKWQDIAAEAKARIEKG